MKFSKTRKVKTPTRANLKDAGIDFYIPEDLDIVMLYSIQSGSVIDTPLFYTNSGPDGDNDTIVTSITLEPGCRVLIPSGIHVRLDSNTALIFMNKSGIASKTGLVVGSSVVDELYTGEIHLSLINTSNVDVIIKAGQKIVQGIIFNMNYSIPEEVFYDELYKDFESTRGTGGFGHTGAF